MKSIMAIATAVVCSLALTACGGGGDSNNALSRADEGIWSDHDGMQAVILSDGSYWGIYGMVDNDGIYNRVLDILHGTASVNGNSVSGSYTDFPSGDHTYSGTVSTQSNLNLALSGLSSGTAGNSFKMSYDGIYTQSSSLSAISGHYLAGSYMVSHGQCSPDCFIIDEVKPSLTISDSNLTLNDQDGSVLMTGTITPHGTEVNIFDVSLTTASTNISHTPTNMTLGVIGGQPYTVYTDVPVGTTFNGILFQTSSGSLKNNIQIVATAGINAYYFIGSK